MTGRYIAFDVETPNYANDRISAIGVTVVEKGAGNANGLVDLFHSGMLDTLPGHQLQCGGDERATNSFPVRVGISNLWYVLAPNKVIF